MAEIGVFKVTKTSPINGSNEVKTTDHISITFNVDVDSKTLTNGITVMTKGINMPVNGSLSYDKNRTIIFRPAIPFKANTGYDVIVSSTIKSILGKQCQPFTFSFTTYPVSEVNPPVMLHPVNLATLYNGTVEFSWNSVKDVNGYDIQLSKFENFSTIEWTTHINCPKETNNLRVISITPEYKLNNEVYYWRVRATYADSSPLNSFNTRWTESYKFNIEVQENPYVVPEDNITDPFTDVYPMTLLETFPENNFSNVGTNLNAIYFIVEGIVDPKTIDPRKFLIEGTYITEDVNLNTYDSSATTKILTNVHHGEVSGSWTIIPDEQKDRTIIVFQPTAL